MVPAPKKSARKKLATLTDAAQMAGVSTMTVSRVVNGNGYVSSTLRRKVERVLEKLQYSPNHLARGLKGTRTNIVGVLLPDLANPFAVELARGIEEALSVCGYFSFVISAGRAGKRELSALQTFSDHRVAGAILAMRTPHPNLARTARERFPIALVGPELACEGLDYVTAAYRDGGLRATRHLLDSGRRRIAYIGASPDDPEPLLRFQGYTDALREAGIAIDRRLIQGPARFSGWCSDTDGYEAMKRLLALPCPPDAVFARNDYAAIGALRAIQERGLRTPDDIALAGFDNVTLSAFTSPGITTVDQFVFEQGKAVARMLIDRMESDKPRRHAMERIFPCELVVRQSSALRVSAAA